MWVHTLSARCLHRRSFEKHQFYSSFAICLLPVFLLLSYSFDFHSTGALVVVAVLGCVWDFYFLPPSFAIILTDICLGLIFIHCCTDDDAAVIFWLKTETKMFLMFIIIIVIRSIMHLAVVVWFWWAIIPSCRRFMWHHSHRERVSLFLKWPLGPHTMRYFFVFRAWHFEADLLLLLLGARVSLRQSDEWNYGFIVLLNDSTWRWVLLLKIYIQFRHFLWPIFPFQTSIYYGSRYKSSNFIVKKKNKRRLECHTIIRYVVKTCIFQKIYHKTKMGWTRKWQMNNDSLSHLCPTVTATFIDKYNVRCTWIYCTRA